MEKTILIRSSDVRTLVDFHNALKSRDVHCSVDKNGSVYASCDGRFYMALDSRAVQTDGMGITFNLHDLVENMKVSIVKDGDDLSFHWKEVRDEKTGVVGHVFEKCVFGKKTTRRDCIAVEKYDGHAEEVMDKILSSPRPIWNTLTDDVKETLERFADYSSGDVTREFICGVGLDVQKRMFVSTDGHRMALRPFPAEWRSWKDDSFADCSVKCCVFPAQTVAYMKKLGFLAVCVDRMFTAFKGGGYTFVAINRNGTFPAWWKVSDKRDALTNVLDCSELGKVLFDSKKEMQKRQRVFIGRKVTVQTENYDYDAGELGGFASADYRIPIDGRFLLDLLRHVKDWSSVAMKYSDDSSRFVLFEDGRTEETYIIQPMSMN